MCANFHEVFLSAMRLYWTTEEKSAPDDPVTDPVLPP